MKLVLFYVIVDGSCSRFLLTYISMSCKIDKKEVATIVVTSCER